MLLYPPPLKASNFSLNIVSIFLANSFLLSHILFYPSSILSFHQMLYIAPFLQFRNWQLLPLFALFVHRFSSAFASVVLFSNCFRETFKKKPTTRSLITQPVWASKSLIVLSSKFPLVMAACMLLKWHPFSLVSKWCRTGFICPRSMLSYSTSINIGKDQSDIASCADCSGDFH